LVYCITDIILALTTVSFGVTGYSLPWDQVAHWVCKIVTSVPEALDKIRVILLWANKEVRLVEIFRRQRDEVSYLHSNSLAHCLLKGEKISVLILRGNFSVNQSTLTRFYSIHTFLLPLLTLILVIIHFSMFRTSLDLF
jgi:cytochrome b6